MSSSTTSTGLGFIPKCLTCLRDAGSIGFYFLECGHFTCEDCILRQQQQTIHSNSSSCTTTTCQFCHVQCKAISLMDASNIPKNIYEFVSSKYRNVFQEPIAKMEEIIKFQHSHYEHVIRQLKSENQSLKETIQMLNQKKNSLLPFQQNSGGLVNSVMMLPEIMNQHPQEVLAYYEDQNKGFNQNHPSSSSASSVVVVNGEASNTPHVNNRNSINARQQLQQHQRMNETPSMSPLSSKSSSRMSNYNPLKEDSSRRSVTPSTLLEKLRNGSPKLPSVSPIRASLNQNLNESLPMIMNQLPSSPSGYSDSRLSFNGRLSMDNNENIDPKNTSSTTPMKGKSLLPSKTPRPGSSSKLSVLQSGLVSTPQLSKQSPNGVLTSSFKSILPSRSAVESQHRPETFIENQASDLGLPNRSQTKEKPLLKKKPSDTPPLSSLGIQKQNKTLSSTDPTRTPLLSRKLMSLSTPTRQRPQSSRGIPPK